MKNFIHDLLGPNKELGDLYAAHLLSYDELLPHVFFGEVTHYIEQIAQAEGERDDELERIISLFNYAYMSCGESVRNVLSVSFLENLDFNNKAFSVIKSKLHGGLAQELKSIEEIHR